MVIVVERTPARARRLLIAIKVIHTVVWALFVTCILALPIAGAVKRFDWAMILTMLMLFECFVLAMNRGVCPLTPLAARYTSDRSPGFDIYLPEWLAKYNKVIFGSLFVVNELILAWQYAQR